MFDEYRCFVEELKRELMQATGKPEACFEFQEKGDSGDVLTMECVSSGNTRGFCTMRTEKVYELFRDRDDLNVKDLVREILKMSEEITEHELDLVQESFSSYENAKEKLFVRLLNYRKAEKELSDAVYCRMGDICMVLCLRVSGSKDRLSSTRIPKHVIEDWGCKRETVFRDALVNTYFMSPPRAYRWEKIFKEPDYPGDNFMDLLHPCSLNQDEQGNCISTVGKTNGAVAIFLPGVAARLSELLEDDLYLAFTSIHEVMVHKAGTVDPACLKRILTDTIREATPEQDYLSEEIYHYDRTKGHFSCVTAE